MPSLRSGLFPVLLAWIPKRNTAAVHTWPAFDDTALALIPELEKSGLDRIYYLAAGDVAAGPATAWGPKVTVLPKRSLRAAWAFLTSRYVFFTHQCYTMKFPRNVVSVNLWHGMPIKKIGWMRPGGAGPCARYELATSGFWKPIIQACMKPWGEVLVNGLPRCDRFSAPGRERVRKHLGGEAATRAKLVVWLPTYRQTVLGDPERDGRDFNNAAQMPGFDPDRFDAWLAARNLVCVLKPHPLGPKPEVRAGGNLRILDDAALAAQGLTLYSLLGGADALVTDLSSVYVDFLALDRPVIHAFADRAAYGAGRGFTFEWTEDFFAGPMVEDMAGVERALDEVAAGRDAHAAARARLRKLFHADPEQPATPALLGRLGLGFSAGRKCQASGAG
jgi:CDP-glycerol glycerophosphotransferase (TagB/SpsB family)